ncbi:uncharacterized protein MEPE_00425 [Melanopsichium pennsylvanicum]|uniref:Uncharacterized protein n=2 Tax=Melanopsichium pennsylvanicum TaxID=63383 RepID=A0AAJ5C2M5_9BASI|nr:uncharacterized protein BN887_00323 [Melanopsichium pennsylvanicum 4]SNX81720.1 uncharacterized protein MEPE_00425 [Melanopsichium pennsylvanicum]
MAPARRTARSSFSALSSSSNIGSTANRYHQRSSASFTPSSASKLTTTLAYRPAANAASTTMQSTDQSHPPSPSKSQASNSYDDPIDLSDTDTDLDAGFEVVSPTHIASIATTALLPSSTGLARNMSLLSPSPGNIHIERSHSTSSLDRSYATSLNSDLHAISDGSLSSLSSVDSDSDGPDAAAKGVKSASSPTRDSSQTQHNRPANTLMRASEESLGMHSHSSSSAPTPSRRSARIVSSGSSVQKALQRRDELDAKLTGSSVRRKLDSPEASPQKRRPGRPRKSATDASLVQALKSPLAAVQTATATDPHSSPAAAFTRRSARLSLPSSSIAAALIASKDVAVQHSSEVLEVASQEPVPELRRGRRSCGSRLAEDAKDGSASLPGPSALPTTPASSVVPSTKKSKARSSNDAADKEGQDVSVTPVKRGPGRPRLSRNVVSPSPLAPVGSLAKHKEELTTRRLRKRSLSSASAGVDAATSTASRDATETPRKRSRLSRRSLNSEPETSSSAPIATPEPDRAAQTEVIVSKDVVDLLDDDLSELSDVSDMDFGSPGSSQSGSHSRRRGRPSGSRNAEASKLKRASRPKDGKSYHFTGLYAGEADAVASISLLRPGEIQNAVFPTPVHFGAKLLTEERDFCLPYPIHQKMDQLRDRVNAKRKPPRYQQISKNKYYSRPKLQGEVQTCSCKAGSGCGDGCINRMLMYICDPRTCPSASNCTNVSLGQRPAIKTAVAYYGRRGFGLKTLEPIKRDDFIDEYRGEVINLGEAAKRVTEEYKATGNYYLLDYDSAAGELLDGGRKGNITRFANHSCDPNCRIEKFIICGTDEALSAEFQIGLFAIRDIDAGEELTYNYGWAAFQPRDITGAPTAQVPTEQCLCGAANCSGILGGKKAPATKAAVEAVEAKSRKKTAKGRGKSKGKGRRTAQGSRVRMRAMTPMLTASQLSAAAMPTSTLLPAAAGRKMRQEAQPTLRNKIVVRRRERLAREANEASSSTSLVGTGSEAAVEAMNADGPTMAAHVQRTEATKQASSSSKQGKRPAAARTSPAANPQEAQASTSGSESGSGQATTSAAGSSKASASAPDGAFPRLRLLKRLASSKVGNAVIGAATAPCGAKKDRRWSAAGGLNSDNDDSSSWDRDLSDTESLESDFQKQDDVPQQRPASKKTGGKSARRGRHKLQLSSEEAERRATDRRARNAFLARVRRASKRGIVIEDPTQHPLKKISIQCTAAPENTYIPDLPSSLVTLGMSTADARRARNAFLARVRRTMKRGYPKDVAIKMAAKPLPGDPARDTPVMKAQRAYMEQLEREAVDELSASVHDSSQTAQGLRTESGSQPPAIAGAGRNDGWVDESSWSLAQ